MHAICQWTPKYFCHVKETICTSPYCMISFVCSSKKGKNKLWWKKSEQWLTLRIGDGHWQERAWENFLGWCNASILIGVGVHRYMHLSKVRNVSKSDLCLSLYVNCTSKEKKNPVNKYWNRVNYMQREIFRQISTDVCTLTWSASKNQDDWLARWTHTW